MSFDSLRPILYTNSIQGTIDFYTSVLGFTLMEYNEEWKWASLQKEQVSIMLALINEHIPHKEPVFTGSLYINVTNVNELWEQLKDKTKICYPVNNFDWQMREFGIYDNNGYVLQFGQSLK